MSHPFSLYSKNIVAKDTRASVNSSLLTPPSTPLDEHEAPFKPNSFDTTSLSMKKRHQKGSHHSESTSQLAFSKPPTRRFSFNNRPLIKSQSMVEFDPIWIPDLSPKASRSIRENFPTSDQIYPRRWTLPSKASSTQSVTTLRSMVRQAMWNEKSSSPAMITLRRATNNGRSRRSTGLTFFPEPEFGNQKQSFMANFVKTLKSEPGTTGGSRRTGELNIYQPASQSSKICQPTPKAMAPTIQTAITIEPERFLSSTLSTGSRLRRCSTRYVYAGTSYEVVWDDTDNSRMHQDLSQLCSEVGYQERRDSAAVSQLEIALRRSQDALHRSSQDSRSPSDNRATSNRRSFTFALPTKSEQNLSQVIRETTMKNLPRSRTGEHLKSKNVAQLTSSLVDLKSDQNERQGTQNESMNLRGFVQSKATDCVFWEGHNADLDEDRLPLLHLDHVLLEIPE